ncbi:uncharacterized protein [Typha latifolia]|uniref:uncharacterized protein n=1 Tax=Typha latifolia TaxID=4733 RepID=UPI003C303435
MVEDITEMLSGNPCSYDEDDELHGQSSISSNSDSESSSSDLTEDATSSPNPPPSLKMSSLPSRLESKGPLYELSSLMEQLPVKKGLSNFYQGKSQSFTSLSDVKCVEDLAKKESPYRRKTMKPCKSYGGIDEAQRSSRAPGPCSKTIMKKPSRSPCATMLATSHSNSFLSRPPRSPVNKDLCDK